MNFEDHVIERRSSNGITVLMMERHDTPTVSVHMVFRVGSVDDPPGKSGLAHLFEHMMFKGTEQVGTKNYNREAPILKKIEMLHDQLRHLALGSKEALDLQATLKALDAEESRLIVDNEFQKIYSREGAVQSNAFTSTDITRYFVDIPSSKLDLWAILESDRLKHPVFRQFYSELEVVKEEHRMRLEDNPENALEEKLCSIAFTLHPYGRSPLGTVKEIDSLSPQDLRDFYAKHYRPENLILSIVGDIDPARTMALVEQYFGDWHVSQPVIQEHFSVEPVQTKRREVVLHRSGIPQVMMGFHMPTYPDPDYAAYFALFHLLGNREQSFLFRRLVEERKIAATVKCVPFVPGERFPTLFVIYATVAAPHTAKELEAAIMDELQTFSSSLLDAKQVQKVQPAIELELSQTLLSNHEMASRLAYYQAVDGNWRSIVEFHQAIARLTPLDLQRVARKIFIPSNENAVYLDQDLEVRP